ncbi:hypothetical protein TanjilG_13321 [Lupinus angustifolius]|uniref:C3H1-type domain-containing protein n=1 Tax=Lupinus angustifolius TaxID=3871 RepID=A0A4P1RUC8_LUPAN|nr:PREDICTED: zinc finger CCCH domain-containing protein 39-like [Lupinus angustifolius]OIW18569.1 hypothetical protein TanjilG_13321 [Lupinus angustifolius]
MSFFDDLPPYVPSPPPYAAAQATDAIVLSLEQQFPENNESFTPHSPFNDHDQPSSFKRPRTSSESSNHSNAVQFPPRMTTMHSQNNNNNASNKGGSGTGHIFFKTRMCAKFRLGSCRNGENCNFAHGVEDMRQPPPNWQELVGNAGSNEEQQQQRPSGNWDDDQKIIHKMKLCKKYYNGEECPFGERCNFLHEDPAKFRDDSGRIRESSAISIGTNGSPKSYRDGYYNNSETSKAVTANVGINAYRGNVRSTFWKTKLCIKWETTGHCPFGDDCHFAHGQSELHVLGGRTETEAAGAIPISTYATVPTLPKVTSVPSIDAAPAPSNIASPPLANEVEQGKKSLLKWKGPKKINRIYADWLDDFPLVQNVANGAET